MAIYCNQVNFIIRNPKLGEIIKSVDISGIRVDSNDVYGFFSQEQPIREDDRDEHYGYYGRLATIYDKNCVAEWIIESIALSDEYSGDGIKNLLTTIENSMEEINESTISLESTYKYIVGNEGIGIFDYANYSDGRCVHAYMGGESGNDIVSINDTEITIWSLIYDYQDEEILDIIQNNVDARDYCEFSDENIDKEEIDFEFEENIEISAGSCLEDNVSITPIPEAIEGDTVAFGEYKGEEVKWQVLEKRGTKLMLLTRMCIDAASYNDQYGSITWADCTLRSWLNEYFINETFDSNQQQMIIETKIENSSNPHFEVSGGRETVDRVFLLSVEEAEKYFETDDARMAKGTSYAMQKDLFSFEDDGIYTCTWWLRSPGNSDSYVCNVDIGGGTDYSRSPKADTNKSGVRPAMWIDITSCLDR